MRRMSRSARLFDLLHLLRSHRRAVSGQTLAQQLGISIRTLYRDIASLQAQGAKIEGEPGVGYLLKPGFVLPPLMFTPEEVESLVLGARWVAQQTDDGLAAAARSALARIAAVLPPEQRHDLEASALLVATRQSDASSQSADHEPLTVTVAPELLRKAVRNENKLHITYHDAQGAQSRRTVWPFALAYFERARVLMCWCELRQDFRYFRTDRIASAALLDARYPQRKQALLKAWRLSLTPEKRFTILPETDSL
jgi:predicted DNA-binding transcriptional regulator YafY